MRNPSKRARGVVIAAAALGAAFWVAAEGGPEEVSKERAARAVEEARAQAAARGERGHPGNELGGEPSPYLQLHAENPVAWKPWGPEAFRLAKVRDVPVFLSVGYSTCFWCHVMERKVFSDAEIAALMNEHFVSIKVDREERPDVDEVYMTATRVLTRSGGWPNSIFLTPEGKPFYAGTYFPPESAHGRPGFPQVLRQLAKAWKEEREEVLAVADRAAKAVRRASDLSGGGSVPAPGALLADARKALRERYEPEHGGFSPRRKFPRPPTLGLLLEMLRTEPDPHTREMLHRTLEEMALGGIYDHLAGGFHRYATEPTWSIPHFEKMLYDNAQLLGVYARAYAATERPLYRRVVEDVGRYLEREMRHPGGGYYSAQDAQVEGVEGASYIWTRAEVEEVLGEEATERLLSVYELVPMPEHAEGSPEGGGLRVQLPIREVLERTGAEDVPALLARFEEARAKLLAARSGRPQPLRDEKVLAGWNGLAMRGLVEAAEALGDERYLRRAEEAAAFVLGRLQGEEGTLHRSYVAGKAREAGVLTDYAYLADGLLALHAATGDARRLRQARALADTLIERFEDPEGGGFFLTAGDTDLFVRPKPFEGGVRPSGNAAAVRVLRALAARTGEERYAAAAERSVRAAGRILERAPSSAAALVAAAHGAPGAAAGDSLVATTKEPGAETAPESSGAAGSDFDLPRSEDHVLVRAEWDPEAIRTLRVRMAIDEGWHVNANPASLPFLEPTELRGEGGVEAWPEADVDYPEGERFAPEFSEETLSVYEGELTFTARLGEEAERPSAVALRYQACELERCLPPSTSRVEIVEPEAR